jgi:hypothetical protein
VTDLVRLLHVAAMATWLGSTLWLAGDARRAAGASATEALSFLGRARAAILLDRAAGAVTIFSGLLLLHLMKTWPPPIGLLVGMGLAVVRAGLTDAVMAPALRRMATGLAGGAAPASLAPMARRLSAVSGVGHLAWLGALATMMIR